jgi:ribosomal protein S24E
MELKIINDTENNMLKRRELEFYITGYEATNSKADAKRELCKKLNLSPDNTVIVSLNQEFGMKRSVGIAHSYSSAAELERVEPKFIIERMKKSEGSNGQPKGGEGAKE